MNKIVLSDDVIEIINNFLEEVLDLSIIECIYLVSFFDEYANSIKINVVCIKNNSSHYNNLIDVLNKDNGQEQLALLYSILNKYNENNKNINFSFDTIYNYRLEVQYIEQILAIKQLISSYILFDRYGYVTDDKKRLSDEYEIISNVLEVLNISYLNKNYVKRK